MSLPVFLLLSILTVQRSGGDSCESFRGVVQNIQTTVDSDHAGFRKVFPKDYQITHHYNDSLLCSEPCCVFYAAAILSDSWNNLYIQLWPENNKLSFIAELLKVLTELTNMVKYMEDPDPSILPSVSSSPEDLLSFTSSLFSKFLELRCLIPMDTCSFPTVASPVGKEEAVLGLGRGRSLTTRAVHTGEHNQGHQEKRTNGGQLSVWFPGSLCSLLFYGLSWWLL